MPCKYKRKKNVKKKIKDVPKAVGEGLALRIRMKKPKRKR